MGEAMASGASGNDSAAKGAAATAKDTKTELTQIPADQTPYELSPEKMMMDNLFILGMLFFIFYFILIRPQQKRMKIHNEMMKALAKGNRIMTSGGIIGTIMKFEGDDIAVVEIAQGVKVRIARSAISEVMSEKSPGESANDN